jgi:hypothetical protein
MPLPSADYAAWVAFIDGLMQSGSSTKTVLTDLLRVASVTSSGGTNLRGGVQFDCHVSPSMATWAAYRAGTVTWSNVPWPQGLYGPGAGVRQVNVAIELQLMPQTTAAGQASAASRAIPSLGSATLRYELKK